MNTSQAKDIAASLHGSRNVDTLRLITCGSVGAGKSTLIECLISKNKGIREDQLDSLQSDSRQYGMHGENANLASLADGLQSEREPGLTIEVAYRYFATELRRYIVPDTPGLEQHIRNMATGAFSADLALVLVDARKGVTMQTRLDSRILAMFGVPRVALAVTMMDLIGFSQESFDQITSEYRDFAAGLGFASITPFALSGLNGDNVLQRSSRTLWYAGPSLMEYLESVDVSQKPDRRAFRMPVQWVDRPGQDFKGLCGTVAEGEVRPGDEVRLLPSGVQTRVKAVISGLDSVVVGRTGEAIAITLADAVQPSRGDVIVAADLPPEVADQFEAKLLWMGNHTMAPGRQYLMRLATKELIATVTDIKYQEDVNTGAHLAAKTLGRDEIATINLSTNTPVVFEPYRLSRVLGGFILMDKLSFEAVGVGTIDFALRRASNIHWQALELNKASRASQKLQSPRCIWLTGLSGSGKSTIANLLEKRLHAEGKHTYLLDGDNVRHGLNRDLGFTEADRVENIRRVAEVAKLMVDAGLIVLVSFISPFRAERAMARGLFQEGEFIEVHVDAPIAECEKRDVKGLYVKARKGELKNFTGIDSPYEAPEAPEVCLPTTQLSPQDCVERVLGALN